MHINSPKNSDTRATTVPTTKMKNGFVLSLLFAICTACAGYWLGQHNLPSPAKLAEAENTSSLERSSTTSATGNMKHPALPNQAPAANTKSLAANKLSLPEIETKLLELKKSGFGNMGLAGMNYRAQQD